MRVTITVVDPSSPRPACDVEVDAPPGTTLGDVRRELCVAVGGTDGALRCGAVPVTDALALGRPPLVTGAVLTLGPGEPPRADGVLELEVCAGLDAGAVHRLPPGDHVVGRGVDADIRIEDPGLSRAHCLLQVGHGGTTVVDLDSANGTVVAGAPVGRSPRRLRPGEVLHVGDSRLRLGIPEDGAPTQVDPTGHLLVSRPPMLVGRVTTPRITVPAAPEPREPTRLPWAAIALPALLGVGLLLVTRNVTYLLFVLLSPVTAAGSWLGDRVERQRAIRRAARRYAEDCRAMGDDLAALALTQAQQRDERFPALSRLGRRARAPDRPVWRRRADDPEALAVRVGLGRVPVDVALVDDGGHAVRPPPGLPTPSLDAVPVTLALDADAPVGLAGPLSTAGPVLRSWLVQLACLAGPSTVQVRVLSGSPDEVWAWLRWLPQSGSRTSGDAAVDVAAELDRRLAAREKARPPTEGGPSDPGPRWVVVLDGADVARSPVASRLLTRGADVGMYAVAAARAVGDLPAECSTVVELSADGPPRATVRRRDGDDVTGVHPDGLSRARAEEVARSLAPLREAGTRSVDGSGVRTADGWGTGSGPGSDIGADDGDEVRLVDLLGRADLGADALAARWSRPDQGPEPRAPAGRPATASHSASGGRLATPVGRDADGRPVVVDLVGDGPHVLLAGTTGSGKSELLQSLVAGLAVRHRPDLLAFVLVDFKGGAAFRECARLPHTVGLVTDLAAHEAGRLLESLRGLVARRERLLAAAGAVDVDDYGGRPGLAPMPRMVVVIDEFATLHDELPDLVQQLVSVARRGRSLGLHLVLATQRPAGVVSHEIRANVGLRLCLRVSDVSESVDVVEAPDAASIRADQPGRGYLLRSGGRLESVQVARVTGASERDRPAVRVRRCEQRPAAPAPTPTTAAPGPTPTTAAPGPTPTTAAHCPPSDLDVLVEAACAAAASLQITPAPSPWLPPLPDRIDLPEGTAGVEEPGTTSVVLGLTDAPEQGRQPPWRFDPAADGNLLVVGAPRSGRSQTLLTAAARAASRRPPTALHLYLLDGSSRALEALARWPHCAAHATHDDPAFAARVLRWLVRDLDERERAASAAARPAALLVIDDWTRWRTLLDVLGDGSAVDDVQRLARSGPAVGLGLLLSGERDLLGSRLADSFRERLVLRLADRADFVLAGLPLGSVPRHFPPGRGVLARTGRQVQVTAPTANADAPAGRGPLTAPRPDRGGPLQQSHHDRPPRLRPLPALVTVAALWDLPSAGDCGDPDAEPGPATEPNVATRPGAATDSRIDDRLLLGLGGDHAEPIGFDPRDGRAFVVVGPPRSGRSSVLRLVALTACRAGRPVVVVAPERSPLASAAGVTRVDPGDGPRLRAWLEGGQPAVVLVDDAEAFHDCPVDDELTRALRPGAAMTAGAATAVTVFLSGTADDLGARFRGFTVAARRERCGLLLGECAAGDGDLLGARLPRQPAGPPGRGLLVVHGQVTPVQVAWTDGGSG